ncbi:MAG: GNAT family N-acetyltransferase [Pyrinomonadaceae bacterium]
MQNLATIRDQITDRRNERFLTTAPDPSTVEVLTNADGEEALAFLNFRPVHTVVMTSFIIDNGIESGLNRGRFHGYRNAGGKLEGIALIGHTTLVEARTDAALKALAFAARGSETPIHLIMSDGDDAEVFWAYFTGGASRPRLTCTENLFETAFPFPVGDRVSELRPATIAELIPVAEAQAEIAMLESGVDPMVRDREGFLDRVTRRIEQGRVFVVTDNGRLVFKADVIAETTETAYLEGIYVAPEDRGKGIGPKCLSALTIELLGRVNNVCLLSNVDFESAHKSYYKAGFKNTGQCTTLFV